MHCVQEWQVPFSVPPAVDESLRFPFSPRENQFATSRPALPPSRFFMLLLERRGAAVIGTLGGNWRFGILLGWVSFVQPDCGAVEGGRGGSLVRLCGTVCPPRL